MKRSKLRLVCGEGGAPRRVNWSALSNDKILVPVGHQWPLPLDDKSISRKIIIVITNETHGQSMRKLIEDEEPHSVLDLRHLLRFDMPGISRDVFFEQLRMYSSRYVRIPIAWHKLSQRDFMSGNVCIPAELTREVTADDASTRVLLVTTEQEASELAIFINGVLSLEAKESWNVVVLSENEPE